VPALRVALRRAQGERRRVGPPLQGSGRLDGNSLSQRSLRYRWLLQLLNSPLVSPPPSRPKARRLRSGLPATPRFLCSAVFVSGRDRPRRLETAGTSSFLRIRHRASATSSDRDKRLVRMMHGAIATDREIYATRAASSIAGHDGIFFTPVR